MQHGLGDHVGDGGGQQVPVIGTEHIAHGSGGGRLQPWPAKFHRRIRVQQALCGQLLMQRAIKAIERITHELGHLGAMAPLAKCLHPGRRFLGLGAPAEIDTGIASLRQVGGLAAPQPGGDQILRGIGRAPHQRPAIDPPEKQLGVIFHGHAIAAEHPHRHQRGRSRREACPPMRHGDHRAGIRLMLGHGIHRAPAQQTRALKVGRHVGQRVRQALKLANLAAKGLAAPGIIGCILHRFRSGSGQLRGGEQAQFLKRGAEQAGGLRVVDPLARAHGEIAQAAGRDGAVDLWRLALRQSGRQIVQHPQRIAIQPQHRPGHGTAGQHLARCGAQILRRKGDNILPLACGCQPCTGIRRQLCQQAPHHNRLHQGHAGEMAPGLLGHNDGVQQAGIPGVRRAQQRYAQLPHFLPQSLVKAERLAGAQLAQPGMAGQQATDHILQHGLLFGKFEIHGPKLSLNKTLPQCDAWRWRGIRRPRPIRPEPLSRNPQRRSPGPQRRGGRPAIRHR